MGHLSQAPEALRLIREWGFTYKSVAFVWLKNRKADSWFYGLGFWTRANAEVCLLATRGHPKRQAANIHQFIISPIEAHSKKPDETRDKIVALMGDLPRVELLRPADPARLGCVGQRGTVHAPGLRKYGGPAKSAILWGEEEQRSGRIWDNLSRSSQAEFVTTSPQGGHERRLTYALCECPQ